jgi:tetratricopeptide repeat protein 8
MVVTYLELAKVYLRLDQPIAALDLYTRGSEKFPGDVQLMLGAARVHEALNDLDASVALHKKVIIDCHWLLHAFAFFNVSVL